MEHDDGDVLSYRWWCVLIAHSFHKLQSGPKK